MSLHRRGRRAHTTSVRRQDGLTLAQLGKELDTYSVAISTQVRTINLGVLGLSWLMLLGDEKLANVAPKLSHPALMAIALACLLALVLDLGQYLLGERAVLAAFDDANKSEQGSAEYNEASFAYRAPFWCYRAKLVLTLMAAAMLIALVSHALI